MACYTNRGVCQYILNKPKPRTRRCVMMRCAMIFGFGLTQDQTEMDQDSKESCGQAVILWRENQLATIFVCPLAECEESQAISLVAGFLSEQGVDCRDIILFPPANTKKQIMLEYQRWLDDHPGVNFGEPFELWPRDKEKVLAA